jgi:hypothetical protein
MKAAFLHVEVRNENGISERYHRSTPFNIRRAEGVQMPAKMARSQFGCPRRRRSSGPPACLARTRTVRSSMPPSSIETNVRRVRRH